jgi:hypothetical protein
MLGSSAAVRKMLGSRGGASTDGNGAGDNVAFFSCASEMSRAGASVSGATFSRDSGAVRGASASARLQAGKIQDAAR